MEANCQWEWRSKEKTGEQGRVINNIEGSAKEIKSSNSLITHSTR